MSLIKYIICVFSFSLFVTASHANNIWQENSRRQIYQTVETIQHQTTQFNITQTLEQFRQTTVNLDNTLFGRAHKIQSVDITGQIRSAWSQGYTGQGIAIGILDFIAASRQRFRVRLNSVNSFDTKGTAITSQYVIQNRSTAITNTLNYSRSYTFENVSNDGNYDATILHPDLTRRIVGGKYEDSDGTLMMGIAKDATLHNLEAMSSRATTFNANRLDFINASLSNAAPSTIMTQAYQAMDASDTYPQGHLPVYISAAGNNHGLSATYAGITRGDRRIVNYFNAEMALSTETFDGRPLSDYLLVAGGVRRTGDTTFAVAGNMPGEVTELQNRWLVAPYTFQFDNRTISGTSLTTPYITGIAGIVNSKFPNMTPADVANLLLNTARDLGATGTDAVYGRGMVDLSNALSPQ
ncbi:MAG: S8 family serine peptidase [Desulfobacterales bacterium]|nr:S8 family serine peptidase [Desulfobacterales bacterium]